MTPPSLAGSCVVAGSPQFPPRARPRTPAPPGSARHQAPAPTVPAPPEPPATRGRFSRRLRFDHLGEREATIAFEALGDPKTAASVTTVVLGGISAGRHLMPASFDQGPGWWPGVVGRGAALDPARRPLVGVDYLGGTDDPGRRLRPVTTHDQARAVAAALDHLGIGRASFVGASYGGMVALAFAELFPERIGRLVVLCAAHRTHPMATAVRSVQRAAVGLGVESGDAGRGLSLARALAMTTYRSSREFEERFSPFALSAGGPDGDPARFPVEEYLEARGADFVRRFDTERFLALSESIDLHATRPGALPRHALLISFDTDVLTPPWLMDELAARDPGRDSDRCPAHHVTIPSPYGHDAFLKETDAVSALLRGELETITTSRRGNPMIRQAHANGQPQATSEQAHAGEQAHANGQLPPAPAHPPAHARFNPPPSPSPITRAVRSGLGADTAHGAVMPPIHLSSNFLFDSPGVYGKYDYTRSGNPTRDLVAGAVADLEGGCGAVVTSSGMSAISVVTRLLSAGDLLVAPRDCYGGSHRLFTGEAGRGSYRLRFIDPTDPAALAEARALRPRAIWLETPSNPLLRITDIAAWSRLSREIGAICVVDNTFLSPVNQRPLDHGADLVVHSTTKFLNGHSDVVGGAVVAAHPELLEEMEWWTNAAGVAGSPFDAYLTLRGTRTLHARSRIHEENALHVVAALARHEVVAGVHHPSLPGHPGHDIAKRQQTGWGSLVSFDLRGGRGAVDAFVEGLEHFALAESLGGVESLVAHPATMTHAAMDERAQAAAGIGQGLLRLSVGIEAAGDLVADLERALYRAEAVAC